MRNKPLISRNIPIEQLINNYSFSTQYLREKGIRCIRCGEPIWGTLEEAAKEKEFNNKEIDEIVNEMNSMAGG